MIDRENANVRAPRIPTHRTTTGYHHPCLGGSILYGAAAGFYLVSLDTTRPEKPLVKEVNNIWVLGSLAVIIAALSYAVHH